MIARPPTARLEPNLTGRCRAILLIALLAWSPLAAAIDPVTLILMRMLRDKIITALADSAVENALKPPEPGTQAIPTPPSGLPPPGLPEAERLRYIIDRNFTYLPAADREQVYRSLTAALDDPANGEVRARIISEFTQTAVAVGQAQWALERLTRAQKQELASSAAAAFQELPPDQRQDLLNLLRAGHVPIPPDLSAMMLREIAAR